MVRHREEGKMPENFLSAVWSIRSLKWRSPPVSRPQKGSRPAARLFPLHSGWMVNGKAFNMADHCVVQTVSHWRNVCQSQLSGLHWSDLSLDPLLKSQVGFHWPAASEVIKTAAHAGRTRQSSGHKSDLTQPRSCNFDLSWVISASLIEDSTDLHTFSTVGIWGDRTEWWSLLCVFYLEASS